MPAPTPHKLEARRQAEEVADDIYALCARLVAEANKRFGAVGNRIDTAYFVGPLFFYGGPFVDSGSGDVPLSDTSNGHGGGTGFVANSGKIMGVTIYCQVPPASSALSIPIYINGASIGTVSADAGQYAFSILASAAGLSVDGLTRGDWMQTDWVDTDGTVAGVHVHIPLQCDVQRGVG